MHQYKCLPCCIFEQQRQATTAQPAQPGRFCHLVGTMQHKKTNRDSKFSLSLSVSEGNLPSRHAFLYIMNYEQVLFVLRVLCSSWCSAQPHCLTHVGAAAYPFKCWSKIDLAVVWFRLKSQLYIRTLPQPFKASRSVFRGDGLIALN